MEELYNRMQILIVDIEKMWIKIVKYFDNEETCYSSMPNWFMKSYDNKINMLKDCETLFFQNESDLQKKKNILSYYWKNILIFLGNYIRRELLIV